MKKFLAIALLIIGASVVSAQTNETAAAPEKAICTLTLAQAPEIRGLRLDMTVEQVLALFPGSNAEKVIIDALAKAKAPNRFGSTSITITPDKYESKAKFAGLGSITFRFVDGRVSTFRVGYNNPEWKNVDEFIAKFSVGWNLPAANAWEPFVGMDEQMKTLKCNGFEMSAFAGGKNVNVNYIEMKDTAAEQKLKERAQKAAEKEQKETKP